MNRQILTILLLLTILIVGFIIGNPFESSDRTTDRICTILPYALIVLIFVQLSKLVRQLDKGKTKILLTIVISILAVPYILVGIVTILFVSFPKYQMWQDIAIYKNSDNERVISQWRETSGSIYDYRCRKTLADFGQIRISFDINPDNMKGLWTQHLIEKDSTFIIDLDKDIVDYSSHTGH